jgi:hypothetical protein
MATNGAQQGFEPVLAAHNMMQSAGNRAQKEQAHQFLEQFQKSVCLLARDESSAHWTNSSLQQEAWTTTLAILESPGADAAAKLFAATTLKGKVGCHVMQPCFVVADSARLYTTSTRYPAHNSQSYEPLLCAILRHFTQALNPSDSSCVSAWPTWQYK